MTNEEFYKDDLRKIMINTLGVEKETGEPAVCEHMKCTECLFEPNDCNNKMERWLQSEHVEQVDWSKVKVDTPIYVRSNENSPWIPRHFARYENGKVYAWCDGSTSFTEGGKVDWNYAKLAESED